LCVGVQPLFYAELVDTHWEGPEDCGSWRRRSTGHTVCGMSAEAGAHSDTHPVCAWPITHPPVFASPW
jgi:hypothetical protein